MAAEHGRFDRMLATVAALILLAGCQTPAPPPPPPPPPPAPVPIPIPMERPAGSGLLTLDAVQRAGADYPGGQRSFPDFAAATAALRAMTVAPGRYGIAFVGSQLLAIDHDGMIATVDTGGVVNGSGVGQRPPR